MAQTCTGDCLKCSFQQQTYCSAQRTYGIMENQKAIVAILERLEARLVAFSAPAEIVEEKAPVAPGADTKGEVKNP